MGSTIIQGNDDLVRTIVDLSETKTFTLTDTHGVAAEYTSKPVHQVKAAYPAQPPVVSVQTLAGFVDLINAKLEDVSNREGKLFVHVVDEDTVHLESLASDTYGRRLTLIKAAPVEFDKFRFGCWLDQEQFMIQVAAKFADGFDKNYVLDLGGALISEAITTNNDNGFAQSATIKRGARLVETQTIKPKVTLAPFRTFPDIAQPSSEFVFRARTPEGQLPELMLIEADGGRWKIDAINEIARFLRAAGLEIPVIS